MKIFEPIAANGYEWVHPVDSRDFETFRALDGSPLAEKWKPVKVKRVRADSRQACKKSDFPWLGGHVLVIRQSVIDSIGDLLETHGEILPLETDDGTRLFVFNCRTVDALDLTNSTVLKSRETGRIMYPKTTAFIPNVIRGKELFRLPLVGWIIYVSEHFIVRYRAAKLVGLEFKMVWSEIEGPVVRS